MTPVITFTTQPIEDPRTPTLTHYDEVAGALLPALDAFLDVVPKLEEAQGADAKQVRRNLNVPDAFCYTALAAAEQLPELETARKLYAERDRNRLQFIEAIRPVHAKVKAVFDSLEHVLRANKSIVAGDSLEILRIARAARKNSRNPALPTHIEAMAATLAKHKLTKAERSERKAAKLNQEVEKRVAERLVEERVLWQEEVKKAA
jgi:hypothetical protein